jgi:hypothetical protein
MHPTSRLATVFLLCLFTTVLGSASVHAAVPSTISYQGLLTDGAGTPVADGPYNLTLKLYGVSSGGAALWSETQSAVSVVRGIFSINLGSVSALALPFDQPYWLGVSIGADAELAPRTPLTSSPYALNVRTPLPANSVNAQVILDEPGIAQSILFGSHAVIGNANISPLNLFEDLNVTITTPGPGYVMLHAVGYITFSNVTGQQYIEYQISETTGQASPLFVPGEANYLQFCGFGTAPNTNYFDFPMACQRVFYKPVAGPYKFSYCTARLGSFNPQASVTNLSLTATYFPTSYGTVSTVAGAQGNDAARRIPGGVPSGPAPSPGVDIR